MKSVNCGTEHKLNYENTLGHTSRLALDLKGAQDAYMTIPEKSDNSIWNTKKTLLNQPHKYVYDFIANFSGSIDRSRKVCMTIPNCFHLISELDLVIEHSDDQNIHNIIKTIEVEIGGQRIDRVCSLKEIQLNCQLLNTHRRVKTIPNQDGSFTTIIPLELAPFRGHEICLLGCLYYHEIRLNVQFGDFPVSEAEVWGKTYNFDEKIWNSFYQKPYESIVVQNQFNGEETLKLGTVNKLKLNFNHPISCIYFWGMEKQFINKITLMLNGHDYLQSTPLMLDYIAETKGIALTNDTCVIFLSDGDLKYPNSWINFSVIDNAQLILDLKGDPNVEKTLHVVGLNHQPLRVMSGMAGLAFSK